MLIAGPAPLQETGARAGGPAAALVSHSPPLTLNQARAMQETVAAMGPVEPPHPVLPSVMLRENAGGGVREGPTRAQTIFDNGLNALVILFLGWIITLVLPRQGT